MSVFFFSDYTRDCNGDEKTTVLSGTATSASVKTTKLIFVSSSERTTDKSLPKWVLPVCITVGILVLAILILVGVLFVLRRKRHGLSGERSRGM